jgi:hypothetical protein
MSIPLRSIVSRLQISSQGQPTFTKRQTRNYEHAFYILISGLDIITKYKKIEDIIWRDEKRISLY